MDSVPKILPMWHDVSMKEIFNYRNRHKYLSEKTPDYCGIGVDFRWEDGEIKGGDNLKSAVNNIHFSAKTCALPFLPLKKVGKVSDPCVEILKKQSDGFYHFCTKLEFQRRMVNYKQKENYKAGILSLWKKLKKYSHKKKFPKVLVPEKIMELSKEIPYPTSIPDADFSYLGGSLVHSFSNKLPVLLFSSGENLSELSVVPLVQNNVMGKAFSMQSCNPYTVELKDNIFQISSAVDGLCYVRQKNSIQLVNFMDLEAIKAESVSLKNILNVAASPYNPLEYFAVFPEGKLRLQNFETKSITKISDGISDQYQIEHLWQCSFGSQPLSALCLSNKQLYLYDLRLKKNMVSELFSSTHPTCYVNEELTVLKTLTANTFQHFVASNRHLFLCDERYPKEPVMVWNHMLRSHPLFCSNAICALDDDSSDVTVLLGTQSSKEVCSISLKSNNQVQPITLSLPLYLSSPSDFINSLKLQCVFIDPNHSARFSSSLIGLCVVPHNCNGGFTCFQLTSLGDVFYQDFYKFSTKQQESNFRVGTGCVLMPANEIIDHMTELDMYRCVPDENPLKDDLIHINVDTRDVLKIPCDISADCISCRSENSEKILVQADDCPFCGLDKPQSQYFSETAANLGLIVGNCSDEENLLNFNNDSLSEFTDPCSKKILQCWTNASAPEEPSASLDLSVPEEILLPSSTNSGARKEANIPSLESAELFSSSLFSDFLDNANFSEELIPPSQDTRPLIGETLHTPAKPKPLRKSTAGF